MVVKRRLDIWLSVRVSVKNRLKCRSINWRDITTVRVSVKDRPKSRTINWRRLV